MFNKKGKFNGCPKKTNINDRKKIILLSHQSIQKLKLMGYGKFNLNLIINILTLPLVFNLIITLTLPSLVILKIERRPENQY